MKRYPLIIVLSISFLAYSQTSKSGNIKDQVISSWSKANEKDFYHDFIIIPENVSPGYVKVSLNQGDKDLRPAMVISRDLNKSGAIISGSSAKTNNELNRTAYFSAHPGTTYSVKVYPFFNAKEYPIKYTLSWEFFERDDMYEPNDIREQAKQINFNQLIEAYAIVGYIKQYYIGTYDENTYDWYKVNLDENKKISVKVLDSPDDLELNIRVINAAGRQVGTVITRDSNDSFNISKNGKGLKVVTTRNNLAKGTYYLEVHPRMKGARKADNDTKPIPDHFNKPYKFIVTDQNIENSVVQNNNNSSTTDNNNPTDVNDPIVKGLEGKWKLITSNNSGYDGMLIEVNGNEAKIISQKSIRSYKKGNSKWKGITQVDGNEFAFTDLDDKGLSTFAVIRKVDKNTLDISLGSSVAGNKQTWQRVTSSTSTPIDANEEDISSNELVAKVLPCEISENMVLKNTPAEVDYIVNDNCVINVTGRLTIESGVVIEFGKDAGIGINGNAEFDSGGGQKETILRGKENKSGYWRGIHIETDFEDSIEIINTKILNAGSKSVYSQNTKASIYYVKGNIEIFNNTIAMSGGCGFYYDSKIASLTNTIINNQIKFYENVEGDICGLQPKPLMGNYERLVLRKRRSPSEVDYIVQDSLTAKDLLVDAGVIVEFEKEAGLNIIGNGRLSVKGESQKEVILRGKEARPGYWRGIYINTPRESKVKSAKILHAGGDNSLSSEKAAIHLRKGSLKISNSTIEENEGCLVSVAPDAKLYNSGGNNFKIIDFDKLCYQSKKLPCQIFQDLTLNNTPGAVDYIVDCVANVRANLVIKPGVVIEFSEDAGLSILGRGNLVIEGSPIVPAILQGKEKRPGYWRGIHIETDRSLTTKIENAKIQNAGSNSTYLEHNKAAIYLKKGNLTLNSSVILNNNGCGVFIDPEHKDDTTFTNNNFKNNVNGDVCLEPKVLSCQISQDTVLKDTPAEVDYIVNDDCIIEVTASLKIDPGVVIEFGKDAGVVINDNGEILARDVILKGQEAKVGYWRGIHVETDNMEALEIHATKILHGGSKSVYTFHKKAAISIKKGGLVMENCTIAMSGGCGVYFDPEAYTGQSLGINNTFYENAEGHACIEPKELSGGNSNRIHLDKRRGPNEVDYFIKGDYNVAGKLTIDKGVIIEFDKDAALNLVNDGEIDIKGELNKEVILRGKEAQQGYWRGIYLSGDVRHAIQYAKIEHTGSNPIAGGILTGIHLLDSFLSLKNTTISQSAGCGIFVSPKATLSESNNTFSNNKNDDMCNKSSD